MSPCESFWFKWPMWNFRNQHSTTVFFWVMGRKEFNILWNFPRPWQPFCAESKERCTLNNYPQRQPCSPLFSASLWGLIWGEIIRKLTLLPVKCVASWPGKRLMGHVVQTPNIGYVNTTLSFQASFKGRSAHSQDEPPRQWVTLGAIGSAWTENRRTQFNVCKALCSLTLWLTFRKSLRGTELADGGGREGFEFLSLPVLPPSIPAQLKVFPLPISLPLPSFILLFFLPIS